MTGTVSSPRVPRSSRLVDSIWSTARTHRTSVSRIGRPDRWVRPVVSVTQLVRESRAVSSFAAVEATTPGSSRRRSTVNVGSGGVARSRATRASSKRPSTVVVNRPSSAYNAENPLRCRYYGDRIDVITVIQMLSMDIKYKPNIWLILFMIDDMLFSHKCLCCLPGSIVECHNNRFGNYKWFIVCLSST